MIKGNISLDKLSEIFKERQKGLIESIWELAKKGLVDYEEARKKIDICEQLQGVWIEIISSK